MIFNAVLLKRFFFTDNVIKKLFLSQITFINTVCLVWNYLVFTFYAVLMKRCCFTENCFDELFFYKVTSLFKLFCFCFWNGQFITSCFDVLSSIYSKFWLVSFQNAIRGFSQTIKWTFQLGKTSSNDILRNVYVFISFY